MKKFKRICSFILAFTMLLSMGVFADEAVPASSGELSQGQRNIILRARQLMEIEWTPLIDRYQWGYAGTFASGTTYTGAPYGQPVFTGYLGFAVTLDQFIAATEDNTSHFYTRYSTYNKIAPSYSIDCSGFVSWSWGISRKHTGTLPEAGYLVDDQSINGLEVADCLNNVYSHAVLVSDVVRDGSGNVVSVEIMEQTPVITRTTRYGQGGTKTLDYFNSYYFGGGYKIYRNPNRDSVEYTHSCAVPLDDEWCENCRRHAPYGYTTAGDEGTALMLSYDDSSARIYYTTDGSDPAVYGSEYTQPIVANETVTVKACAVFPDGSASRVLTYKVSITEAAAPCWSLSQGLAEGNVLSMGSAVSLHTETSGADIYYTTDGSEPTSDSAVYSAPILINSDTVIKAFAGGNGYKPSETVSFDFALGSFSSFEDVKPTAWYAKAVEFAFGRGLFKGVSDSRFAPDETMTRGMFVTVLGRMAGVPADLYGRIGVSLGEDVNVRSGPAITYAPVGSVDYYDVFSVLGWEDSWYKIDKGGTVGYIREDYVKAYEGQFADLDESKYYSPYVQWVYLTGISSGTGSGTFSADENISRENMCSMLYNYTGNHGISLPQKLEKAVFSDDWQIGDKTAVYALQQAGVVNGKGDGTFEPLGSATRAQVAKIFMEFAFAAGE